MVATKLHLCWISAFILLLLAASACQAAPPAPTVSVALETVPVASRTATPLQATDTPPVMPTPTRTSSPTSTLTASPVVISYAPLTSANIHQLTKIGQPFQTFDPVHSVYPMIRYTQMIFRSESTWVAELESLNFHHSDGDRHRVRVSDINGTLNKSLVDEAGGENTQIELIVASPDGRFLAGVDVAAEHIILWDMDTLKKSTTFEFRYYVSKLNALSYVPLAGSFSSDGRYLAVAGCRYLGSLSHDSTCLNAGVNIYDITTNELVNEISVVQGRTADIEFQPGTSHLVVAGSGKAQKSADLLIWDVEKDEKVAEIMLEGTGVWGEVAFDSTGSIFAAELFYEQERESRISFWDTQNWSLTHEISIENGLSCEIYTFVPGTQMLVYVCSNLQDGPGHEHLLFVDPGTVVPTIDLNTGLGDIDLVSVSPNGRFLYTYDVLGFLISRKNVMPPHIQRWGVVTPTLTP